MTRKNIKKSIRARLNDDFGAKNVTIKIAENQLGNT